MISKKKSFITTRHHDDTNHQMYPLVTNPLSQTQPINHKHTHIYSSIGVSPIRNTPFAAHQEYSPFSSSQSTRLNGPLKE